MARSKGVAIFAVNFEPTGQSPLDARLVVNTVAELTAPETYADKNVYNGMTVTVIEDGSIHVLTNMNAVTTPSSWKKVDAAAAVQTTIVNDLTTGGASSALSAEQGKVLKGLIDAINTKIGSVDNIQEAIDTAVDTLETKVDSININGHSVGDGTTITISKGDVGLGNVTNEAQIPLTQKGVANGVASLDENGLVPSSQLPSYVDDVLEFANEEAFPGTGEAGKIYVAQDTNLTYRWSGSQYTEISKSLALGTTSSTAFPGDRGLQAETDIDNLQSKVTEIDAYTINGKQISTNPTLAAGDINTTDHGTVQAAITDLYQKNTAVEGSKCVEYTQDATSGNTVSIPADTHGCGTHPMVTTYFGGEIVDTQIAVAADGAVTVSWNGSAVTAGSPLTVVIVGCVDK